MSTKKHLPTTIPRAAQLLEGAFFDNPGILYWLKVKLYRLAAVSHRLFERISLADTAGK
jgi:hypothetical protein